MLIVSKCYPAPCQSTCHVWHDLAKFFHQEMENFARAARQAGRCHLIIIAVTLERNVMYKKKLVLPELTEQEQNRLKEIQIYLTIYNICKQFNSATVAVDFIEYLTNLNDGNYIIISQVVLKTIKKDPAFVPSIQEVHVLLYRAGYSVRRINEITKRGNNKIYVDLYKYAEQPFEYAERLTSLQHTELDKLINCLKKFGGSIVC